MIRIASGGACPGRHKCLKTAHVIALQCHALEHEQICSEQRRWHCQLCVLPAGARETYLTLMAGMIGCDGAVVSQLSPASSAMALEAISWQYQEYTSYEDLRNSLIEVCELTVQHCLGALQLCLCTASA